MDKWGMIVGGTLVAGILAVGWQLWKPVPSTVGHSMETPVTGKTGAGAPIVKVKLPDALSANAQIGERAFEAKCASCHGKNAVGQNGVAPPLIHKIYEPSHHADMAFVLAVRNGVRSHHWPFGDMPPVEGLTQADVQYIAKYVRELQRENGIK